MTGNKRCTAAQRAGWNGGSLVPKTAAFAAPETRRERPFGPVKFAGLSRYREAPVMAGAEAGPVRAAQIEVVPRASLVLGMFRGRFCLSKGNLMNANQLRESYLTFFEQRGPVLAGTFGVLVGGLVVSQFVPKLSYILPLSMDKIAMSLLQGQPLSLPMIYELITAGLFSVLFMVAALWRFSDEEF